MKKCWGYLEMGFLACGDIAAKSKCLKSLGTPKWVMSRGWEKLGQSCQRPAAKVGQRYQFIYFFFLLRSNFLGLKFDFIFITYENEFL